MIYERVWLDNPEDREGRPVSPVTKLERTNAGLTRNRFFWIAANPKRNIRNLDAFRCGLGVETWDRLETNHFTAKNYFHGSKIIDNLHTGPLKEYFLGKETISICITPEIAAAFDKVASALKENDKKCRDEEDARKAASKAERDVQRDNQLNGRPFFIHRYDENPKSEMPNSWQKSPSNLEDIDEAYKDIFQLIDEGRSTEWTLSTKELREKYKWNDETSPTSATWFKEFNPKAYPDHLNLKLLSGETIFLAVTPEQELEKWGRVIGVTYTYKFRFPSCGLKELSWTATEQGYEIVSETSW